MHAVLLPLPQACPPGQRDAGMLGPELEGVEAKFIFLSWHGIPFPEEKARHIPFSWFGLHEPSYV